MPTKKIYIQGMHCVSCEKLLNDELKNVSGVQTVKADRKTGIVEIGYDQKEPEFSAIKKMAEKFGYNASEKSLSNDNIGKFKWAEWLEVIGLVVIIFLLYGIFKNFGILDRIDLNEAKMSYGISFLVGLVASVSSCLAVVGAVVIAFAEKYKTEGIGFFQNAVRPNLFFHVGRLSTFFILGGLLGMIGGEINISGNFISIFTIIIAVVMSWLGLNILGLLPSISSLGISLPGGLTRKWVKLKKSEHRAAPFLLGGLSFFLPCGFTQSMQIFALTSGSFLVGGISLFLFALGTVPSLLALGITASWTQNKKLAVFQKVAGLLIIVFAFYTLQSGLALKGVKANILTTKKEQSIDNQLSADKNIPTDTQEVLMKITASGFEPNILKVKSGVPVKWVINGDQVTGCTSRIIVPSLNISRNITRGENIITFTPMSKGDLPFSCGMGMVRGKFIVE
jgi:sulfite exporter TauE/SafE/copper chaperone CopZ